MSSARLVRAASWCLPMLVTLLASLAYFGSTAPAEAETSARPWWQLTAITAPANLPPGGEGQIHATITNIGDANASVAGEPLTITDNLPAGLEAVENGSKGYEGPLLSPETPDYRAGEVECTTQPSTVTCTYTSTAPLAPFVPVEVEINVKVNPDGAANKAVNELTASGGGVPPVTVRRPLKADGSGTAYGIEDYELTAENEGGSADTQAGSHPFQLTTTLGINNLFISNPSESVRNKFPTVAYAAALTRDLVVKLPPGLVGNATTLPKCTEAQFTTERGFIDSCPANTAVGVASATLFEPEAPGFSNGGGVATAEIPIFNLPPAEGEPARFGFDAYDNYVTLDTSVRTGKDYAVVTTVNTTPEISPLLASSVTLWGVPGDSRHNEVRGWECLEETIGENSHCSSAQAPPETPFLTLPGSCTQPLSSTLRADSWKEPGNRFPDGSIEETDPRWTKSPTPEHEPPTLSGCSELPFAPSISAQPETQAGSTPTGLSVDVHMPQPETANSLAEADVKDTTVTLPQGVELNPAASHGLEACTEGEVGYIKPETFSGEAGLEFTPTYNERNAGESCPKASKVATVKIKTPLLAHELEGSVFLAEPAPNKEEGKNPFQSLIALYIVAEDPVSKVLVKLAGEVSVNEQTGQATTTFKSTPQTPFEDLKMNFFSGPTATLTTPAYCGTYTTAASFTPWSGTPAVEEGSSFGITSNCTQPGSNMPFGPSLAAGSSSNQAGAFSPFTVSIGNPDGNQPLNNLTMHLPPGVAAMISSVTPCPAAQAFPVHNEAPHCGAESIVGHSVAFSGLGGDPYELPGTVYLTGPYKGAPFGLAVSTHAKAGPFDLGYIVVGSTINVDENTAAVTVTSDPFPQFIRGIPSALKQIVVTVERPGNAPFEFNPTNCNQMAITGTLTGIQGGVHGFNQPFQVANCAKLPFKPTLTASTKGNASKANGAEFVVRVTSTPGQANIAKTKLQLPLQLPSRLTTIQKACRDTVFEKNPAACDEGSNIGTAIVHTPVFKNPLMGPAYLVSHGNAAFPDVEFVLQGEGVTLILDGQTDIKKGITTSTFNSVPDAPVTTFETILPEGPHSALTSNVPTSKAFNLCGQKLVMPTTITGQNGVVITQQTKIPVGGCAAVKPFKESRATKLAKALKKCRKQFKHSKKKRASCEAKARKKYGAKKKSKKKGAKKK